MPDMLIRNIKPETMDFLKRKAAAKGHSVQAEVRALLDTLEAAARRDAAGIRARATHWRETLRDRVLSDSTDLIREDRNTDHGHA